MAIAEDLDLYQNDNTFVARGQISGDVLTENSSAAVTIQTAIDWLAESGGGEVALQRGVYPLDQPVSLRDRTTLRGKGSSTRLVATPANEAGTAVLMQTLKAAELSDLLVEPASPNQGTAGVVIDNSGACRVSKVKVQGFRDHGLWLRNNSFLCEIVSSEFVDNGVANVFCEKLREGGRGGNYLPNLFSSCRLYGGQRGFVMTHALVVNVVGCLVSHTRGTAFELSAHSNSVQITGCRTYQIGGDALTTHDSHELNASSNIFSWHRGNGIVLSESSWITVTGNNVIDTGVRDPGGQLKTGLVVGSNSTAVLVSNNNIFNWGDQPKMAHGITEDATCSMNQFIGNNINYFAGEAVRSEGRGTVATDNVSHGPKAFKSDGLPPFPDFTLDSIETFIRE